jgi:hypothetical protein
MWIGAGFFLVFLFCRWRCKFRNWSCNPCKHWWNFPKAWITNVLYLNRPMLSFDSGVVRIIAVDFITGNVFFLLQSIIYKCVDPCNITWSSTCYLFLNQFQWIRNLELFHWIIDYIVIVCITFAKDLLTQYAIAFP